MYQECPISKLKVALHESTGCLIKGLSYSRLMRLCVISPPGPMKWRLLRPHPLQTHPLCLPPSTLCSPLWRRVGQWRASKRSSGLAYSLSVSSLSGNLSLGSMVILVRLQTILLPIAKSWCVPYHYCIAYNDHLPAATHTITLHLDMTELDLTSSKPVCTRGDLLRYRRLGLSVEEVVEVTMKLNTLRALGINLKIEGMPNTHTIKKTTRYEYHLIIARFAVNHLAIISSISKFRKIHVPFKLWHHQCSISVQARPKNDKFRPHLNWRVSF